MFAIFGSGTQTRRLPRPSQKEPWFEKIVPFITPMALVIFLVLVGGLFVLYGPRTAAPVVQGQAVRVPSRASGPESQNIQENLSVAANWPNLDNVWRQRIAAPTDMVLAHVGPNTGSQLTADDSVFARRVLPELSAPDVDVMFVARATDPANANVVLASIGAVDAHAWQEERVKASREDRAVTPTDDMFKWSYFLLLSVDGEKSWHKLRLLPTDGRHLMAFSAGVRVEGDSIYAAAKDATPAWDAGWWETTVKREL